ncbi:MAG: sulfate adenylyltransferase [Zetaproteobacteria bacterium CG12_big_fil_rev_8_21_14_0_65_55_1124]|nr:MAG: sulfate adenylyltransferase [Zetaproteobacteria bacterium CG1_02_55_237]PIS19002.1 MAG: sulfate adenylyltransferase [Zetaproteobacteria bacterium CG08_land_8_20_14_0_20_55_17]PIW41922.1 MAG: sulfate adenylyltransferase [Zetaproteobacteria bacterium CG12_big_fil_rev_8_21_14_0_65_55_1124]PIY53540.1 MAG: sulfate adenylyltransferase [Zetaproteobacteria bacterium CG_4_10_14_0_8_um_filter_55_43]PIZ37410.1 MAG: sulfate adenylyltransferase [Zetaproteobacteria bacterium CG_4_10_14_0_2_um_filter_
MTELNIKMTKEIELLRLVTVGSVDDGKSTLIGRLLVDTKGAFEDQLLAVRKQRGAETVASAAEIDLAMLTDGLSAEREQGITIDVAYRYFATPKRKFIMADCPGHEQYTRNMVTGASTASAAIILIDARNGVMQQTRRHTHILGLLNIPHLIVAVNKMDLVGFDQKVYEGIRSEMQAYCEKQGVQDLICIPMSALEGDMVAVRGENLAWYEGLTLLETLETLSALGDIDSKPFRFPVQLVNRPQTAELPDYRGFMGAIASGTVKVGDEVVVASTGLSSKVAEIVTFDGNLQEAFAPQSITLTLEDDIDISRGDMLVHPQAVPSDTKELVANVCWIGSEPLSVRKKYLLKHTTSTVKAMVNSIDFRRNINTLDKESADELEMNEIGQITFKLLKPLFYDSYADNRSTGSFIVIDTFTNNTVGAGMIV